ncbi:MAG: hypothetical protein A2538_02690 [Candidatus Magasanikbacteria bacterium RIFOXYD2_FULL_41_14]|uniref:Lipoprotein n=1 Tax=Candidatus Magasanikbacteria bacterium RIFOXYD2_FULL_41_14 TaxID=1798709 RepID=A0A1F6PCU3_9BACT|nr:MAG: hypothetical protein A2538_02690 [Candidatus Magasanikbacteria bacterium RIFOXYD2_FULL_41_14]
MSVNKYLSVVVAGIFLVGVGCQRNAPLSADLPPAPVSQVPSAVSLPQAVVPSAPIQSAPASQTTVVAAPFCPLTVDLVSQFCTVKGGLEIGAYGCSLNSKVSGMPFVLFATQGWADNMREQMAGAYNAAKFGDVPMPTWNESGVGDLAFLTPLIGLNEDAARSTVESKGYNLYIKKGGTLYQFVGYGKDFPSQDAGNCSVEQMKKMAQKILSE